MAVDRIRIGTRGSPLALAQAHETRALLQAAHGLEESQLEIVVITTSGDQIQDRPLSEVGGKGLFTKEIEEAMFRGDIDVAVHSMKDLETAMPDGLAVGAVLPREDVRDAFISLKHAKLADLPDGAVVGTSSLRRRAQLRNARPDIQVVEFRGNVQTRLAKLEAGVAEATFLACAGLRRLGEAERITEAIATEDMLPAVAQAAIALQVRADDAPVASAIAVLNDEATAVRVHAERVFLAKLDGSCRTPIAGLAEPVEDGFRFRGEVLAPDGSEKLSVERTAKREDLADAAMAAAEDLLGRGAARLTQSGPA
ncbi:MAG: hydroxymethylbilane synthase [Pseudomonadota bacterium]